MIDAWQGYRLEHFIPFTPEVYLRLLERVNEAAWPLHPAAVALGLASLVFAWRGRARLAVLLLAPAWVSSGVLFHLQRYAELNWAAPYLGWAFLGQAALLLGLALTGHEAGRRAGDAPHRALAAAVALAGIAGYPLVAVVAGHGWGHAEIFALHPDPTAAVTLGVVLLAPGGARAALAALVPVLWLAVSTLTLVGLGIAWAWAPAALAAAAGVGALAGAMNRGRARSTSRAR
ncbi:MAG: DUF6064 family protein [Gammaproteobacteria bacterium]|nr:DUF6064 family protein [Gammaproteobacteria bacterium]